MSDIIEKIRVASRMLRQAIIELDKTVVRIEELLGIAPIAASVRILRDNFKCTGVDDRDGVLGYFRGESGKFGITFCFEGSRERLWKDLPDDQKIVAGQFLPMLIDKILEAAAEQEFNAKRCMLLIEEFRAQECPDEATRGQERQERHG